MATTAAASAPKSTMQRVLDVVEKVGNMVPHPAVIFLLLIAVTIMLSHILAMTGASVTYDVIDQATHETKSVTTSAQSLLTKDGIRFIYTSLVPNFMGFGAVGLLIAAVLGVGVAEESGLVKALIRKLVAVAPPKSIAYILVFIGILSSIAADAGYLVLIPLAGAAFLSIGRHPLAGLAAGFAAVAGAFTVNMLIKPLDAVLTEFTNDAVRSVDPNLQIGLTSNLWFSIASVVLLTFVITFITQRVIEPRLGAFTGEKPADDSAGDAAAESRGLTFAAIALGVALVAFAVLTLPSGAALRNPATGALIGDSPFMNGLIAFIATVFFATGAAYGYGAGTFKKFNDVIKAVEKQLSALGGLILLLFIIAQFIAYFNYSNMATILAVNIADVLETANIGPVWLLVGFIVVVALLDLVITGAIAKWAIFAPVFVPILVRLGVDPKAVLAAYRLADSPFNSITPLNAYFALVVGFAVKYDKKAGVGTIVALMLPYVIWTFISWTALFFVWYFLGLPWGI
ncbi:MAG: AbgT family transporter [Phycisphaerales bacterium]